MNRKQIFGLYLGSEVKIKGPLQFRGRIHEINQYSMVVICPVEGMDLDRWMKTTAEDCELYLRSMKDLTEEELMEYVNLQNCNLGEYAYCEIAWKLKNKIALSEDWFAEGIAIKL